MKLWALSDLHLHHQVNRDTVAELAAHPTDWLVLAGDLGERDEQLEWVFSTLVPRFAKVVWVPGNHELWTMRDQPLRGVARYEALVALARAHGVLTPEDPYPLWPGGGPPTRICPLFLLYDYTFVPDHIGPDGAVPWAREAGTVCVDELRLHPDPYPTRSAWCAARLAQTQARLDAVDPTEQTLLINHFPLRLDLCRLFRIPRFTPWCGTVHTEDWHTRYRARAVISGHLHMRATDWRDGVRFEEVSLGYPRQYDRQTGAPGYLREVLPGPPAPALNAGPHWHR